MSFALRTLRRSMIFLLVLTAFAAAAASASAAPLAVVADLGGESVSLIDTGTNKVVGPPIEVGVGPTSVAVTPNGRIAYVDNYSDGTVSVIDTSAKRTVGPPIEVGEHPAGIAISPDGSTAYVTDRGSDEVSVIDTRTNSVIDEIPVGSEPVGIAVRPDGAFAYVSNFGDDTVELIDTKTDEVGPPIAVGEGPMFISFTPAGETAYVADQTGDEVSVIDAATRKVTSIRLEGEDSRGIAITPDGTKAFVVSWGSDLISVLDTRTDRVIDEIPVDSVPEEVAIAPDGKSAYVTLADISRHEVIRIDTTTDAIVGAPVVVPAERPAGIAIVPDQSPSAAFSAPSATAGVPAIFDASASIDPDGTIASYRWAFGDGGTATGVTPTHIYATPSTFATVLGVVDNEGCTSAEVFTGRTAYCSGGDSSVTRPVTVVPPSATVPITSPAPSNKIRFGRLVHNTRNGTARLQVRLPAAGSVLLLGSKVHAVRKKIGGAGSLWLTIHARVELNKRLKKIHRTSVRVRITFTPTGGTAKTVHRSIVLLHAPRRKRLRTSN